MDNDGFVWLLILALVWTIAAILFMGNHNYVWR